jgi:hypothetical protein
VLPKSNNRPALLAQLSRYRLVALPILVNLRPPEFTFQKVFPTGILPAMPKITVEKNTNLCFSKHDIGPPDNGSIIKLEGFFAPRFQKRDETGFHF